MKPDETKRLVGPKSGFIWFRLVSSGFVCPACGFIWFRLVSPSFVCPRVWFHLVSFGFIWFRLPPHLVSSGFVWCGKNHRNFLANSSMAWRTLNWSHHDHCAQDCNARTPQPRFKLYDLQVDRTSSTKSLDGAHLHVCAQPCVVKTHTNTKMQTPIATRALVRAPGVRTHQGQPRQDETNPIGTKGRLLRTA